MKYILALLLCFTALAQQTVNNFAVKTNLTISGVPPALSVNTISNLAALNPVPSNGVVNVAGYLTAGDGGGGIFQQVSSAGVTNLAAISVVSTANTNYAWVRLWDKTTINPSWFGAFPNDQIDDAAQINAALNYNAALKAGTVQLLAGMYDISTTILVPYRANLRGADGWRFAGGVSSISTNISYLGGAPTCIRLAKGANTNMLTLNSTDGPIAQFGDVLEDGEVVDNLTQSSLIENILFFGNGANQTRYDCHGIVSRAKWNASINNCTFVLIKGYAIWLFDANVFRINNIYMVGAVNQFPSKGMFVYSVADSVFSGFEAGGYNGPSVWFNGTSSWVNLFSNSLLYNNWQTNSIYEVTSWTTNTIANFSTELALETGDPLEFRTTGNLPTGFTDTQLYFAVKFATNVFGFHTNRALALAGVYLPGTGAPSGTNYLTIGEPSGLYMSGGSKYNSFVNIRADQNSGPGVSFRDSSGNNVSGLIAYYNTGVPQGETIPDGSKTGVLFDKDSFNNLVSGTFEFQNIGFLARSNAYANQVIGTYSQILTNYVNLSSNTNMFPVIQNLSGAADIGTPGVGTALNLYGNAGGVRLIKMYRTSGVTQTSGFGVSPGGVVIFDETGNNSVATLNNSGSFSRLFLGPQASATPFTADIAAPDGSGVNIAGGALRFKADQSTGNADLADAFLFQTGDPGASGSTTQTLTTKFFIEGDGDARLVGDFSVTTAGKGLKIKEGSNAKMGTAVLVAGTVTVSTTAVGANSRIFLTSNADGGTPGTIRVSARVAGTSFTITSSSGTDTSTIAWVIIDPAP